MRGEQESNRFAQPAAAADRNFSAFWLITMQQHTNASSMVSYSLSNVELNGMAFGMN
jgi:hypothetical protein